MSAWAKWQFLCMYKEDSKKLRLVQGRYVLRTNIHMLRLSNESLACQKKDDHLRAQLLNASFMFFSIEVTCRYPDRMIEWCYIDDGDAIAMARTVTLNLFPLEFYAITLRARMASPHRTGRADEITASSDVQALRGWDHLTRWCTYRHRC